MNYIMELIDIIHDQNINHDWDTTLLLTGDEGKGKSNLGLHIIDKYLTLNKITIGEEHTRHICLDKEQFINNLNKLNNGEPIDYDEAGDLSNKRSMSSFNVAINKAYQVIRGMNLLTVLTIPSLFDLDSFFTKRRAKGLLYVYKRGRVAYWSLERMRKIIAINQGYFIKNLWVVDPTFIDNFPKYNGNLKPHYDILKKQKLDSVRRELYSEVFEKKTNAKVSERNDYIKQCYDVVGSVKTGQIFNISDRRVQQLVKSWREDEKET